MSHPIFKSSLHEAVSEHGIVRSFEAGTTILDIDDYVRLLPIVVSGSVKVIRTDQEIREILLYYIRPSESCIMSFLSGIRRGKSKVKAVIEEDAELILLPIDKAVAWISEYPEWNEFIFGLYETRFDELLDTVNSLAFQKMDDRLLHLLLQKSTLYHSQELPVTHQQLADEMATTREVISRVLKQMEHAGLIRLSRNKISLV
jgi:CRP/FNR family transcriptional regulator, anaerobic regulatory protein